MPAWCWPITRPGWSKQPRANRPHHNHGPVGPRDGRSSPFPKKWHRVTPSRLVPRCSFALEKRQPRRYPLMVPEALAAGLNATASIPLLSGDGPVIGAIGFGWATPQEFGELQVRRLKMIAELGSRTLARAAADPDRIDQRALEDTGAHVLQEAFLPAVLPQSDRLELAAILPSGQRRPDGGRLVRRLPGRPGACAWWSATSSGHGLQPAAVMAQLRNAVRAFADEDPGPRSWQPASTGCCAGSSRMRRATAIIAVWNEKTRDDQPDRCGPSAGSSVPGERNRVPAPRIGRRPAGSAAVRGSTVGAQVHAAPARPCSFTPTGWWRCGAGAWMRACNAA